MSLKNQTNDIYPWDYQIGDDNFQLEPWILEKGKEFVSIEKNIDNKRIKTAEETVKKITAKIETKSKKKVYKKIRRNVFLLTLYK